MATIDAKATATAPPQAVWALLADVTHWTEWGSWSKVEIEGGGEQVVGAIRVLDKRPYHLRERVTAMEPGRRTSYELLDGMKVSGYRSTVTLEPSGDGDTQITWHSEYEQAS